MWIQAFVWRAVYLKVKSTEWKLKFKIKSLRSGQQDDSVGKSTCPTNLMTWVSSLNHIVKWEPLCMCNGTHICVCTDTHTCTRIMSITFFRVLSLGDASLPAPWMTPLGGYRCTGRVTSWGFATDHLSLLSNQNESQMGWMWQSARV